MHPQPPIGRSNLHGNDDLLGPYPNPVIGLRIGGRCPIEVDVRNQTKIVLSAATVFLTGAVWIAARHGETTPVAAVPPAAVVPTTDFPQAPAPQQPAAAAVVLVPAPAVETDRVADDGSVNHVAVPGDTVGGMARDILGKDDRTNRSAIVDANSSLKADPDKLLAGKSYTIPSPAEVSAGRTDPAVAPLPARQTVAQLAPKPKTVELKYTAVEGDTVAKLAAAFLGSDDQAHQDLILAANPTLAANPDRLVAGKTYRIPTAGGLTAEAGQTPVAATTPLPPATVTPAAQPDSDQIIASAAPRTLRYTARPGDTVTTLATHLLGSDTQEARDAIINNNPSLKLDPDHLVAGQTYSIPAPVSTTAAPAANQ
jgi:phage tail protein X